MKLLKLAVALVMCLNSFGQIESILNFDESTGNATSGICLIDETIYGINKYGGEFGQGTFFKTNIDGSYMEVIQTFNDSSSNPVSMIEYSGELFISTLYGSNYSGNILRYNISTEKMDTLIKFPKYTFSPIIKYVNDNEIWGFSPHGNDFGYIFKIDRPTNEFSIVYQFGNEDDGTSPSDFCIVNSTIFVTCWGGGDYLFPFGDGSFDYSGCVAKMDIDGSNYEKIYDGRDSIGTQPNSLIITDDKIYGRFDQAGNDPNGKIFRMEQDGSNFEIVSDIKNRGIGKMILSKNRLIGVSDGSMHQFNITSQQYSDLLKFTLDVGWGANCIAMLSDSTFAVSTFQGGISGSGAILLCTIDDVPAVINNVGSAEYKVDIFPNPARSYINISQSSENHLANIEIYNSLGVLVLKKQIQNTNEQIRINNLTKGCYFVKLSNNEKVATKSIVIE